MIRRVVVGALLLLAAAVLVVLSIAATRPNEFSVQRSTRIVAAPEKIYPLIADFRQWPAWSPWEKLDPAMSRTLTGAPSGTGAVYAWKGNSDVGAGRMEITQASAPSTVAIQLDFLSPFESHNLTEFNLQPGGGATEVTWRMHGPSPFVSKVMSVFASMDTIVGKDFEAGLRNLKAAAER